MTASDLEQLTPYAPVVSPQLINSDLQTDSTVSSMNNPIYSAY